MELPFTSEEFFSVFEAYNLATWPLQVIWVLMAVMAVVMVAGSFRMQQISIGIILGVFWIWMGLVYHLFFFSAINPAARLFGVLFMIQGLLFFWQLAIVQKIGFSMTRSWSVFIGMTAIVYALLIYPILNRVFDHPYPANPTFGLPCPTTIFTLGLFMMATSRVPWWLMIIPLGWCLVGAMAAISLGVWEDLGLPATGVLFIILSLIHPRPKRIAARS